LERSGDRGSRLDVDPSPSVDKLHTVISPAAHIGDVHLNVARLDRSIEFYETRLGFSLHRRDAQTAWLGAGGPDLLVLSQGDFLPHVPHATGLYHFAILVPSRRDL